MNKIYIDDRWGKSGGIGTFSVEINKINKYPSFGFDGEPVSPLDSIRMSSKLISKSSGVIFLPGYIPPLFSCSPYVFTIHDLNHLDRSENSSWLKRLFYRTIIKRGCLKAKLIFTVSEFSRHRIIEWSGVNPDKVINVGNGVSADFSPYGDKNGYSFEYILCVSNRKLHKNEMRTLEAFKKAELPEIVKLVFTGKVDADLEKKIIALGLQDRVIFTGFIDNCDLPKLYRSATALIFVSLYEGFGLPVLEAMASGIPVITSNTTSLREVSGDAALLVDPMDVQGISEALHEIYNNEDIRKKYVIKGLCRAKQYTWDKVAQKVDSALQTL